MKPDNFENMYYTRKKKKKNSKIMFGLICMVVKQYGSDILNIFLMQLKL